MRSMFTVVAIIALFAGNAFAQTDAPASSGTNSATGSSNAAINDNGNAKSSVNASSTINVVAPTALKKGRNSFTEGQARTRIESAGFTEITGLKKDDMGIWRGQAKRDGKSVAVGFDYNGDVGAQ